MDKIVVGKCVSLSSEGKGIIKIGKDVIFIDSLLLGEEAEVEILYSRNKIYYGKIKKLLSLSKDRISPLCPIATACGGCSFQNTTYQYELDYKTNKVKEDLKRIGGIDTKVNPTLGMDEPYFYRNKIQVPFSKEHKTIIYGFYKASTHKIIPFKKCYIESKESELILQSIASLMENYHLDPYDEDAHSGIIRHVLIRTSYNYNQLMVVIVTNGEFFPSRGKFIKDLLKKCPNITTIIQNINSRHTNVILGNEERILFGKGFIEDDILGLHFKISSKSFFQINHLQTEVLYSKALELAEISKDDVVLDAYAGVATIGLLAAKYAKEVISVELEHSAVINAKNNARDNNINNIHIVEDDCTEFMKNYKPQIDVLIMDPPRKGSTPEFLNAVLEIKPKRVIYISCDPSTLARDLRTLTKAYNLEVAQPVDMFPRTHHVETVVSLCLKRN